MIDGKEYMENATFYGAFANENYIYMWCGDEKKYVMAFDNKGIFVRRIELPNNLDAPEFRLIDDNLILFTGSIYEASGEGVQIYKWDVAASDDVTWKIYDSLE
jgi:hypothetical protein